MSLKGGTVLIQKCGDKILLYGAISARESAVLITIKYLKSKDRCSIAKCVRKMRRAVANGL